MAPYVLPSCSSVEVLLDVLGCLSLCYLAESEIVECVLNRPGDCTCTSIRGDIAERNPVIQCTTTFLDTGSGIVIVLGIVRLHLCILLHFLIPRCPVNGAFQPLYISIGKKVIGIATSLNKTIVLTRSTIWHESFEAPGVNE